MKKVNNKPLAKNTKNIATVDQAVQFIIKNLDDSWRKKILMAKEPDGLIKYHWTLGVEIKNMLNLEDKNSELHKSCIKALQKKAKFLSDEDRAHPDCHSFFLITEVAKALKNKFKFKGGKIYEK